MPTSSKMDFYIIRLPANWFVGDAEPYGLFVNLCVYEYNNLPICLSILRHGLRRATSFSKEANEATTYCLGSFGKGAARRAEDW